MDIIIVILFSLIIIPTAVCSALGRKEREQEASQANRTPPNTASQNQPASNNNSSSQSKDDLNDIPFSKLKEYVDAAFTVFSKIEAPLYSGVDSITQSASTDILHLILHLSSLSGSVNNAVSEFIKNLLGYKESPEYWNDYIEANALDNTFFCSNIPLTLRALYKKEEFVPFLETRTDTLCHFFVTSLLLTGKKYLDMCNGGTIRQVDSYCILCYGIEYYLGTGEVKEETFHKNNFTLKTKEKKQREDASSYLFSTNAYSECPACREVFHASESVCPFCNTEIGQPYNKLNKFSPEYEETFYAIGGGKSDIRILYTSATSGRWLFTSRATVTSIAFETYRNFYFSTTMDEYHLIHPRFSDEYYRSGNFLYSPYKLCNGVLPFTDTFSLECYLKDLLTRFDVTDRYVFQTDNTVTYYKDEILLEKGTYRRKGNVVRIDMFDVNTGEKRTDFLGIYRNRLCLETYVDQEGYMKYIRLLTNPFATGK